LLIVRPDFARRIDLAGAGPCSRPVDIDSASTGFAKLVALRVYSFARGATINGEAEDDEVFIVAMRGEADITISQDGHAADTFPLRRNGGLRAAYMPPNSAYRLTAVTDCDIAYARAQPLGTTFAGACGFGSNNGRVDIVGHATAMDLALFAVRAGGDIALAERGNGAERIAHVRADETITAVLGADILEDWSSAAIGESDAPALTVETGSGEILLITAATDRGPASRDAIEIA